MTTLTKSTYRLIYVFDIIIAALLITVGICLILISLLVLRFALVFAMEENYREIGVMKAIGFRNLEIQKIYLIKYLVLVIAGAVFGGILSVPLGDFMVKGASQNLIMEDGRNFLWVNLLCILVIAFFVMSFCWMCTKKMKKVSAVQAIRNGTPGERYHKRKGMHLYRRKMPVCIYLGINDILSHGKRYIILMITFCISFVLISIPLNTLTTMKSGEMVRRFALNPDSAVYLDKMEMDGEKTYSTGKELRNGME